MSPELEEIKEKLIQAEQRIAVLEKEIIALKESNAKMSKKKFPDLRWHGH